MITVRTADPSDLAEVLRLYRRLEDEMTDMHEMWPLSDGVPAPIEDALAAAIAVADRHVYLGLIDHVPLGFVLTRLRRLLPQAGNEQVGVIDLVYTEPEARAVGIAEAMLEVALEDLADLGAERFDAPVLPGHRLAKNFFERSGFSARSIIMHRRKQ